MQIVENLIAGRWTAPAATETLPVMNPSRGEQIASVPLSGAAEVDAAVQAAAAAFPDWAATPPTERVQVLFRLKGHLEAEFDAICAMVSREHGKTLSESRGDLRRGIEMIEFACSAPTLLMGDALQNIARGIDCHNDRIPLGVVAGICPFNFPAMVPLWMWPVAIACGNCFILKPSEKVPLTAMHIIKLLQKSGLPDGVMSIVHGGRTVVESLLTHPGISAISFVGSTAVAKEIYRIGATHGKRVQSAGGAKNFVVVMPDADIEKTAQGLKDGAFGCAGERCMAASTAVIVGDASKTVLPALVETVAAMKVGPTDLPAGAQPDMGAVITAQHREHVAKMIATGTAHGAKLLTGGDVTSHSDAPNGFFVKPTILDGITYDNPLATLEVFGPVLNVMRAATLDEAIQLANRQAYGNGACIFTASGPAAREYRTRVSAGMVGINVGVPAPMAFFPFTGWNESFFGDLHIQGKEGVLFYTKQRTTTTRWFLPSEGDIWAK